MHQCGSYFGTWDCAGCEAVPQHCLGPVADVPRDAEGLGFCTSTRRCAECSYIVLQSVADDPLEFYSDFDLTSTDADTCWCVMTSAPAPAPKQR